MTKMSIRGVSLFVEVIGKGYPLVFMHGGPSLDHTSLLSLKPLADQFTLVFYDHRCNGRSTGVDVTTMTMDNLTADAEALRQALGFDKWAVLGHSFGGQVALEYALRYPQSLSKLILMDTGADQWWVNHNAMKILVGRGFSTTAVEAARRFYNGRLTAKQVTPTVLKFAEAYFYHFGLSSLPGMVHEMLFGPKTVRRPEALVFGYGQMLQGWTVMDRLGEIQLPSLVIAGRYDFLFPPEHQAILADRLPDARLELIECAGHNPQMEQPTATIEALRTFLSPGNPVSS